ncbi:hypothetical protein F5146DRAFT_999282 [Armillaria mellea]|nr:hypothetical protein F5146DRAFT_999282 [Armillaria mellea]
MQMAYLDIHGDGNTMGPKQLTDGPIFILLKVASSNNMSLDPAKFSFEMLSKDLQVLLRKARLGESLKVWDARFGAVLDANALLVTPNASVLYRLPMGSNREIFMCENYRYGQDDHLCWPQPYCPACPYLGCIRRSPSNPMFLPLYTLPQKHEFLEEDLSSAIRGPGLWDKYKFTEFRHACGVILDAVEQTRWEEPHQSLIRTYHTYISMFLDRLEVLPLTFECLQLSVTETQRLVLELQAIMDYVTVYRPRMVGTDTHPPENGQRADDHLSGVFTMNVMVVQECFRAGVPVWMIWPLADAARIRIDALGQIQEPELPYVVLNLPCPRLQPAYVGLATNGAKYKAIEAFTRNRPTNLSRQGRQKPNRKMPNDWVKFKVVTHSYLPPLIQTWQFGLERADADKSLCPNCTIGHQTWRTILQIDWLGTTPTIQSPARGKQACRDQAATFLKGCQDELSIEASVSEINFQLEFFALDRKLCSSESTRHLNLLGQCFPYGQWNMPHHIDLGSANYGIAHSNWIERAPYIFAMRRCMQSWRGCPVPLSASSDQTGGYSEFDVEHVEKEMAYFYVEMFFVTFGREPVLPRRLTHMPNGPFVPEQRQWAQVAQPSVYLDISSWEHE